MGSFVFVNTRKTCSLWLKGKSRLQGNRRGYSDRSKTDWWGDWIHRNRNDMAAVTSHQKLHKLLRFTISAKTEFNKTQKTQSYRNKSEFEHLNKDPLLILYPVSSQKSIINQGFISRRKQIICEMKFLWFFKSRGKKTKSLTGN